MKIIIGTKKVNAGFSVFTSWTEKGPQGVAIAATNNGNDYKKDNTAYGTWAGWVTSAGGGRLSLV